MGQYSIRDIERLSGIKAHTIRIWEKRYNLIQPKRTKTNIRFYSDDDLKLILNISLLNHHGYKISKIAELSAEELSRKIEEHSIVESGSQFHIDRLVVSMIDMDEEGFEKCLDECILNDGLEKTMTEILFPFFTKVGALWMTGSINPGQEHMVSNLVRNKLILAIDRKSKNSNYKEKSAIYMLPENEWHELGLLFHQFVAIGLGVKPIYLGQSVPLSTLEAVMKIRPADFIVVSHLSVRDPEALNRILINIAKIGRASQVILVDKSSVAKELDPGGHYQIVKSLDDFKNLINN